MEQFEGTVLVGESFEPVSGRVVVDDGRIDAIEECETSVAHPYASCSTTRPSRWGRTTSC